MSLKPHRLHRFIPDLQRCRGETAERTRGGLAKITRDGTAIVRACKREGTVLVLLRQGTEEMYCWQHARRLQSEGYRLLPNEQVGTSPLLPPQRVPRSAPQYPLPTPTEELTKS